MQTSTLPHQNPRLTPPWYKIGNWWSTGTYFLKMLLGWYCKHFSKPILIPTGERSSQQHFMHPFSLGVHVSVPSPRAPCPALTPQPGPTPCLPLPEASCHAAARSHRSVTAQAARSPARAWTSVPKQAQTSWRNKRLFPQSASQTARQSSLNKARVPAAAFICSRKSWQRRRLAQRYRTRPHGCHANG